MWCQMNGGDSRASSRSFTATQTCPSMGTQFPVSAVFLVGQVGGLVACRGGGEHVRAQEAGTYLPVSLAQHYRQARLELTDQGLVSYALKTAYRGIEAQASIQWDRLYALGCRYGREFVLLEYARRRQGFASPHKSHGRPARDGRWILHKQEAGRAMVAR